MLGEELGVTDCVGLCEGDHVWDCVGDAVGEGDVVRDAL